MLEPNGRGRDMEVSEEKVFVTKSQSHFFLSPSAIPPPPKPESAFNGLNFPHTFSILRVERTSEDMRTGSVCLSKVRDSEVRPNSLFLRVYGGQFPFRYAKLARDDQVGSLDVAHDRHHLRLNRNKTSLQLQLSIIRGV